MQVDINKIMPVASARDAFDKVIEDVEGTDEIYVLTKNGKPSAVVVGVNHLEKLTGESESDLMAKMPKNETTNQGESGLDGNSTNDINQEESIVKESDPFVAPMQGNQQSSSDLQTQNKEDIPISTPATNTFPSEQPLNSGVDSAQESDMPQQVKTENETVEPSANDQPLAYAPKEETDQNSTSASASDNNMPGPDPFANPPEKPAGAPDDNNN